MSAIFEDIAERFDIPGDAAGTPRVTIIGDGQVLVENHKGLLEYGEDELEINCGHLRVRIRGTNLVLRAMNGEMIIVGGKVFGVDVE